MAQRPAKAKKLPLTPTLTKKPGQVAGLETTSRSAVPHPCTTPLSKLRGFTGGKPASSGLSRTNRQEAIPMPAERTPSVANTVRQEAWVTTQASGAPAMTAPRLPANIVAPLSDAKRLAGNQTAFTLSAAMKATETPTPTSVRPAAATSQAGASAKASEPAAATSEP